MYINPAAITRIAKILHRRDGESMEDCIDTVKSTIEELEIFIEDGDLLGAEEFFLSDLGLEPDYLMDLLGM